MHTKNSRHHPVTFYYLNRDFFMCSAVELAQRLLGKVLVRFDQGKRIAGIIVETEAYAGPEDAACHSFNRRAPSEGHRTNAMFLPGGHVYVYLIYGMHYCFNVVANTPDRPEAVLIRALEPVEGLEIMKQNRKTDRGKNLCSGPGKLCQALGISKEHYGLDLCSSEELYITDGAVPAGEDILATPRINVDYAAEARLFPYRFVMRTSPFLSTKKFIP